MNNLKKKKKAYAKEKMEFEVEKYEFKERMKKYEEDKKARAVVLEPSEIVKLDVGGKHFTSSIATLTKYPNSLLGEVFSGEHSLPKNEEGRYFIDRNGKYFSYILEYLRDGQWTVPAKKEVRAKLRKEVKYFGLEVIADTLKTHNAKVIEGKHKEELPLREITVSRPKFVGFAYWNHRTEGHDASDRLMDEAANKAYPGCRAATGEEYYSRRILNLLPYNTTGLYITFKQPGNHLNPIKTKTCLHAVGPNRPLNGTFSYHDYTCEEFLLVCVAVTSV